MAEHGSLEIPLIDAATDEQTEQAKEEPVPQGEEHLVKSDHRSAPRRTAWSERRSSFFTSHAVPGGNDPLEPGDLEAPPPVTVRFSDQSIDLHAWTYCYENGCADGSPPRHPLDVGDPDEVGVEFPLSGWSFKASFSPANEECGREWCTRVTSRA